MLTVQFSLTLVQTTPLPAAITEEEEDADVDDEEEEEEEEEEDADDDDDESLIIISSISNLSSALDRGIFCIAVITSALRSNCIFMKVSN